MKKINFKSSDNALRKHFKSMFAYDIAVMFNDFDHDERKRLLSLINLDKIADIFVELDTEDQLELLEILEPVRRKSLFKTLENDDLKEFIESLEEDKQKEIISLLPMVKAKTIQLLMTYEEDTAASIMTTDFLTISKDASIKETTNKITTTSTENDYIDTIFVLGDDKRIEGIVDLKELIRARSNQLLENIMMDDFHFVYEDESIEKAIETIQDYDRNAIPVLDRDDRVIGIITADDIFDEIIEDTEYDYQKMALLSDHESTSSAFKRTKQRLPWLMLAVVLNLLIASFLSIFEATIAQVTALVLFQPLILGMAGNIGTQSLAVTILGLHLKEIDTKSLPRAHVKKEVLIGLMNSTLLAIASFGFVTIFLSVFPTIGSQLPIEIAFVVGIAIFSSMFISAIIGVLIPIVLTKYKQDPSAAAGPIITTINDIVALVIYFGVATIVFL